MKLTTVIHYLEVTDILTNYCLNKQTKNAMMTIIVIYNNIMYNFIPTNFFAK